MDIELKNRTMKTELYTCDCCCDNVKNARTVTSGHTLCNDCNINLLKNSILYFDSESGLRIKEKKGDFYIVEGFREVKSDFWESRRKVREQAQMDNCSMVGFDINPSY